MGVVRGRGEYDGLGGVVRIGGGKSGRLWCRGGGEGRGGVRKIGGGRVGGAVGEIWFGWFAGMEIFSRGSVRANLCR